MTYNNYFLDPVSADCYVWYGNMPMTSPVFHYHNGYEIWFLVKGKARFIVEDTPFEVKEGTVVLLRPWEKHIVESYGSEFYERYAVHVSHNNIEKLSTSKTNLLNSLFNRPFGKPYTISLSSEEQSGLIQLLQELYKFYLGNSFGKDVICNAYVAQLCVFIDERLNKILPSNGSNAMPELVNNTMNYINSHLHETITIEALSRELYHNGVYISRCFKQATGLTIKEYILRKRITQTQVYLTKGYSVADSGQKMGFLDPSNFTRTFTKYVGVTPKEYQKRARENKISNID